MDVRGDADHPEPVRLTECYRPWTGHRTASSVGTPDGNLISPRITATLDAAPRGALPLGLGRQAQELPFAAGGTDAGIAFVAPAAIGLTVEPAHADDRQIVGDCEQTPVARVFVTGRAQEPGVLPTSDGMNGHLERIHPHRMDGTCILRPILAAHLKPAFWNADEGLADGVVNRGEFIG